MDLTRIEFVVDDRGTRIIKDPSRIDFTRITTTSRLIEGHREICLMSTEARLQEQQSLYLGDDAAPVGMRAHYSVASTLARVGMLAASEMNERKHGDYYHRTSYIKKPYCPDCSVSGIGLHDLDDAPQLVLYVPPSEVKDWRTMIADWLKDVAEADDRAKRGVWR